MPITPFHLIALNFLSCSYGNKTLHLRASSALLAQKARHLAPSINGLSRSRVIEVVEGRSTGSGVNESIAVSGAGVGRATPMLVVFPYSMLRIRTH